LLGWLSGKLSWYIGCRDLAFKRRTSILSTSSITLICAMYLHGMWMKITGRKFYWKGRKI
ncbi:MAG: hypothetical protein KBS81_00190, partial [Spirochaetales bacterium]|nr:hypothetical protein [Candidatus Physcosoma equi]